MMNPVLTVWITPFIFCTLLFKGFRKELRKENLRIGRSKGRNEVKGRNNKTRETCIRKGCYLWNLST
jgi:hypothetical protein